jgi:hypothetical protein
MNNLNTIGQCLSGIQQSLINVSVRMMEMQLEINSLKNNITPSTVSNVIPSNDKVDGQLKIGFEVLKREVQLLKEEFDSFKYIQNQLKADGSIKVEAPNASLESIFLDKTTCSSSIPITPQPVVDDIEIVSKKKKAAPKKKVLEV